jgi:hypothetical protein
MLSAYGTTEQMRVTFKDYQVVDHMSALPMAISTIITSLWIPMGIPG